MNQPKGSLFDEYPRLGQFVEAMKKRHPEMNNVQCKNLYLIQTEDVDGNIIDEKYGVNLMTDVGADALDGYYKYSLSWTHVAYMTLYADAPDNGIQYEDVQVRSNPDQGILYSQISRSETTYAMTYDSTSGMLSQAIRIGYASFNYNQGNLTEATQIKRIAIPSYMIDGKWTTGSEVTINDIDALPSNIYKRPNEKLTVYAFWVGSIHKSVIEKAWNNGIYMVIAPGMYSSGGAFQDFKVKQSNSYYFTNRLEGYNGYDLSGTNSRTEQSNTVPLHSYQFANSSGNQDHVHEYDLTQCSSFLFTDPRFYISRTRLCCNYNDIRFDIFKQERLPSPEEIVSEEVYTNRTDSPLISNTFGRYKNNRNNVGILPVIDFDISSVKGFDYSTKDWDIDISFRTYPTAVYDNTFNKNTAINISGQGSTVYVYVNAHNDVPITKFTTSDFSTKPSGNIYATDEYWDTSKWELIPDAFNIPQALQTKKYYIKTGGHTGIMEPVYDQTVHQLDVGTSNNLGVNMPTGLPQYYCVRPITSESKEWILGQEHLLFMDTTTNTVTSAHQLYGDANNSRIDPCLVRYGFDNYVVVTPATYCIPSNVRIYEIGTKDVAPTFTDIPLTWTTPNRVGHYSSTQNGYVVIHNICDYTAYVIDVANQTATQLTNVSVCTAIEGTNYCVYKVADSSPQQFEIYDMSSNTIIRTFELPTGYRSLTCIIGLRNYIYIRDDTNSTQTVFLYRIQENSLIQTNMDFGSLYLVTNSRTQDVSTNILSTDRLRPQLYRVKLIVHNDGFVWMRDGLTTSYVAYDEPETVRTLFKNGDYSEKYVADGISTYERYYASYLGYAASIYKTSDQKHLLLIDPASPYWYRSDDEFYSGRVSASWGSEHYSTKIVTDLGHIFTVKTYQNECIDHSGHRDTDSNTYNAMAYWNNGIIIFHYNGDSKWYPLDWFLPHKVTGTTYTIQSYNNPKSINGKQMMIYYTNRGDIVDTDPSTQPYTPSKIGGFIWTKDVPLGQNYYSVTYYANMISNNLSRFDTNHIVLTNGQQISVSIVGAGDYENETFTWRIRGWDRSVPYDSSSYIGQTFDSGYLSSGGVYTVNTAAGCKSASIIIQCTEHDWLMPYNIANVTITIDGQTFPSA